MELSPKFPFWKKLRYTPSSSDMPSLSPPHPSENIAPDDLTAIPLPPPPPRILPANDNTTRHLSPSTALLQRYKSRAGGGCQSLPDIGRAGASLTSPREVHHRASASTENILDFEGSPLAHKSSDRSGSREPAVTVRASRFTTPLRFHMLTPGDKVSTRKHKSTGESDMDIDIDSDIDILSTTAHGEENFPSSRRRTTRSQTRRDERVDSLRNSHSSQSSSSDGSNKKGTSISHISDDIPPGLDDIRKKKPSACLSPPPRGSEVQNPAAASSPSSSLPMPPGMDLDLGPDSSSSSSANSEDELQPPSTMRDGPDVPAPLKPGATKKKKKRTSTQPFTQLPLPPVILRNPKTMTSRPSSSSSSSSQRINLVSHPSSNPTSDSHHDLNPTTPTTKRKSPSPLPVLRSTTTSTSDDDDDDAEEEEEIYPLALRPPLSNETLGIHQWESPHPSSSRPGRAWGWSKRWSCCACGGGGGGGTTSAGGGGMIAGGDAGGDAGAREGGRAGGGATTIVEQVTCSNLGCGHLRCLGGCRLIKEVVGSGSGRRGF